MTLFDTAFVGMGLEWWLAFAALGAVVGLMAGLLGIGGGALMVPVLTALFLGQGVPAGTVVHLALGTSMAAIILTSVSSLLSHHRRQGVIWSVMGAMAPGVVIGTFAATFLASRLDSAHLALFFAIFMGWVALQMFRNSKPIPTRSLPGKPGLAAVGGGIGGISAMVSIGGGSLTVPYLAWHNVPLKQAIGTSAALGLPISLSGSLGYLVNGLSSPLPVTGSVGFVHVPAVILISALSVLTAPFGARLAHTLPVPVLKRLLGILLLVLSVRMLLSVW